MNESENFGFFAKPPSVHFAADGIFAGEDSLRAIQVAGDSF
tara:strand:- start:1485 stop:1607 length:123 start_codon:yes stop_codon:yes gene_type:complete